MNQTACPSVFDSPPHCLRPTDVPFYYSFRRSLIVGFSDHALALAAPIFAYWFLSLTFHYLDTSGWKWLEKYRIHDSVEVRSRNLASRSQVVWAVLLQQVIQTLLGLVWMSEEASRGVNHGEKMDDIIAILEPLMRLAVGAEVSRSLLPSAVYFVYWWVIPSFQFLAAMYVLRPPRRCRTHLCMTFLWQVLHRHLAIFPPPAYACEHVPV
jgi:sphinganine C4-monooxygenase